MIVTLALQLLSASSGAALLLGLAWLQTRYLHRALPQLRHSIWVLAVLGSLLAPLLSAALSHGLGWMLWRSQSAAVAITIAGYPTLLFALVITYVAGAVVMALYLATGIWQLRRLTRTCERIVDPHWLKDFAAVSGQLGVTRDVILLRNPQDIAACTWGLRTPVIMFPQSSSGWDLERRRIILMHELAHVKRSDAWFELLVWVSRIVFWFHPLIWLGGTAIRRERELASDQVVLGTGVRPSNYAEHLVDILLSMSTGGKRVAVAASSLLSLETRVRAMLNPAPSSPVGPRIRRLLLCASIAAVALCVMVIPSASTALPHFKICKCKERRMAAR
jgi:beta-lactamase regulating signal transducer with metallopeptidase domain